MTHKPQTDVISFPFRIAPSGSVVTRPEDTMDYYAELLAVLVATKPGERPQVPLFGIADPVFTDFDAQELAYKVDLFGPPVKVVSVTTDFTSATEQTVRVEFAPLGPDTADFSGQNNV